MKVGTFEIWKVIQDLYSDMSSQVKWNGHTSKHCNIKQGVRQGGVLSTHLYKLYINDLPPELEKRGLGLTIGLEYCGSPLCADDIVLTSTDDEEIQTMLDIAYKYSCQHRFSLNIFYLLKCAKRIRHKLNKLMKSSPIYNKLQHYLIEHACI